MSGIALGTYRYIVTGAASGTGWGTGTYTDDSSLAAMAVHAGIVPVGGQAIINVNRSAGLSSYTGSTQNGITTYSYGSWGGSYSLSLYQACGATSAPVVNSFSTSPSTIPQGNTLTWNWSSSNATACTVDGTTFPANGPFTGGPYQTLGSITKTVTCSGPGGTSAPLSTTFTVTAQPITVAFAATNTASLSTVTESSQQTIPGTVTGTPLASITGAGNPQLSVNGGAWVTSSTFKANDTLRLRLTSPAAINNTNAAVLTIGSSTVNWSVNTNIATPVLHSFSTSPSTVPQGNTLIWNWSSSNATACTVDGTAFAANGPFIGGPYQEVGSITKTAACTGPGGTSNALSTTFTVTAQPITVAFAAVNTASLSTVTESTQQSIPGTVTGTPLATISGAGSPQLSVNGGAWTTSSTIKANDTLRLRLTSPAATNGTHAAELKIGSSTVNWSVNTNITAPVLNTFSVSPTTTPQGGTLTWNWTSTNATVCTVDGTDFPPNGPFVGGPYNVIGTVTKTAICTGPGGTSNSLDATFTVTAQPVVSGLIFPDVSTSNLGVSTISDEATISMTGTATARISGPSSARFSVNNGAWVTEAQVNNGDKIRLQVDSAATTNATVVATITVGATSEAWAVVTGAIDDYPTHFAFVNIPSGTYPAAPLNTLITAANTVTLSGFNVPVTATISSNFGGTPEISINNGPWAKTVYNVVAGSTMRARVVSRSTYAATNSMTIKVGTNPRGWSVKTITNTGDPAPVVNTFSVSPTTIPQGGTLTWNWTSTNATVCNVDGAEFPPNGTFVGGPYQVVGTVTKAVTCTSPVGTSAPLSATFTVTAQPINVAFPAVTTASLSTVTESSQQTIPGTVTGTPLATITGAGSPQLSVNGGAWTTSSTIKANDTLRLRLTSSASNGTKTATLTIGSSTVNWSVNTNTAAPIEISNVLVNGIANTTQVFKQDSVISISWEAREADQCEIDGSVIVFGANGIGAEKIFNPYYFNVGNKTLYILCSRAGQTLGSQTISLAIDPPINPKPADPIFTVAPHISATNFKQNAVISFGWTAANASECYVVDSDFTDSSLKYAATGAGQWEPYKFSVGDHFVEFACVNSIGVMTTPYRLDFTVTAPDVPLPQNVEPGFDDEYQLFAGYLPGETKKSIYVARLNTAGNIDQNAGVKDFLLKPVGLNGISILSVVPDLSSWVALGQSSSLGQIDADFNGDGVNDLMIKNINSIWPGFAASEVMVYASSNLKAAPRGYRNIDADFKNLLTQISGFISDPYYLQNNAIQYNELTSVWVPSLSCFSYDTIDCSFTYDLVPGTYPVIKVLVEFVEGQYRFEYFDRDFIYLYNPLLSAKADGVIPGGNVGELFRRVLLGRFGIEAYDFEGATRALVMIKLARKTDVELEQIEDMDGPGTQPVQDDREFEVKFEDWTDGLSLDDAIAQYEATTGITLTKEYVEQLFTDSDFAEKEMKKNRNLHEDFRDILNQNVPQDLDAMEDEVNNGNWVEMPALKSVFHLPGYNRKFVSADGHREAVYHRLNGALDESNWWKGTFNVFDPNTKPGDHKSADVDPYFKWGN